MPTGYTYAVQEGKVTEFPEFAMGCARAFGALITMRDSPADAEIPEEQKPSDFYAKQLATDELRLMELRSMDHQEIVTAHREARENAIREREEYRQRKVMEESRYRAMLEKVEKWTEPSADHREFKKFMREQLESSIKHDCGDWLPEVDFARQDEWFGSQVENAEHNIERDKAEYRKECERAESRNRWVRELRESLKTEATV